MAEPSELMATFPATPETQVTIANMQEGPFNRWAFHNLRRLLPTANVWRGTGPVAELHHAPVAIDHIAFTDLNGAPRTVGEELESGYADGFVVLHRGNIVAEHYAHGVEPHEPHLLMSVTKSFAGSLAGIVCHHGLLSPEMTVTDILPELAGSAYDGALVRHVLDMTVGMDYSEDYADPDSDVALLDVAAGWRPAREGAPDNLRDYMKTMRKAGPHGKSFHYVSTNTDVLGWILERVTGTDFATLLSREIWQPMGAEYDAYITLDRLGAPQTDGGLCVTTRDLARFGQLHLQKGAMNGARILPEAWVRDFHEQGDAEVWDRGNFAPLMPGHHYRSKWYTDRNDPHRPYMGMGIHGQMLFVDPVAQVVVARHSSQPLAVEGLLFDAMARSFKAIAHTLSADP